MKKENRPRPCLFFFFFVCFVAVLLRLAHGVRGEVDRVRVAAFPLCDDAGDRLLLLLLRASRLGARVWLWPLATVEAAGEGLDHLGQREVGLWRHALDRQHCLGPRLGVMMLAH